MKLILHYTWRHKRYLLLSMLGVAGFVLIQMGIPTLFKYVLNDVLMGGQTERLWQIALMMLAIVIVGAAGEICMAYANSRIASNVVQDIRNDLFEKTQSFSHAEFDQFSVSSLITSTTSDAYQIMIFVQAILRSRGMSLADAVKTTVFLQDMNDFSAMNGVYETAFTGTVFPARSAVEVAKLPKGALVEIEVVAVR